ncbi:ABC transporter ATP-binding protein [Clostridium thermobutyricum]|uniref:ATP-binding cassette domain-containing protein n=1 Tax=Clostridium thermobutyricum TaxID=29372 RepID=UPI0018A99F85|nr:ABC transporter ATP-binding protein [Clostridium thermobutyricum]
MKNDAIVFKNITKSYGEKNILKDFSLNIKKGEFLTIIGSSGCGKTTILKMINGLIKPNKGNVFVDGKDISKINLIQMRRKIGYVVQDVGLFPHMKIKNNISYTLNLEKKENKEEIFSKVKKLVKIVGLDEEIINRYPNELSGGQRQRVGIARALVGEPDIILMDEPFGAVDEITRKLLQDEIYKIYKEYNVTIVFITHDIREALKLGTRVIVMDNGEIVQSGTPKEIKENPKTEFVRNLIGG